jgi:hypothetical protein
LIEVGRFKINTTPDETGMMRIIGLDGKIKARFRGYEKCIEWVNRANKELDGEPYPWPCQWNEWPVEKRREYARRNLA